MSGAEEKFDGWAIVELLGHRRIAGRVREQVLAGHGVLRIDIPGDRPGDTYATQFYSPAALYSLTPTTEEIARAMSARNRPEPVHRWELPAGAPRASTDADGELTYEREG